MSLERPLRLLTFLTTAITVPFNIAATILSLDNQNHRWARRHVTAFCFAFIPLAMTVATSSISLQYIRKHGKSSNALRFSILDLVPALAYIGVLIPCWVVEIEEFNAGGFGLLAGYTTAPMILNMIIHVYFSLNKLLCLRTSTCQQCPNCQTKFASGTTETTKKGYSLLHGDDYLDIETDPIQYRDSEDFTGEEVERAEQADQAKEPEKSNQNKDVI